MQAKSPNRSLFHRLVHLLLSLWNIITLTTVPLQSWVGSSVGYRWVGLLRRWRQSSWLMQRADLIGGMLLVALFGLAPFVPNALSGLLLAACGAWWVLLTLSDDTAGLEGATIAAETAAPDSSVPDNSVPGWRQELTRVQVRLGFTPIHGLVLLYWSVAVVATAFSPVRSAAISGLVKLTLFLLGFALMARVLRSPTLRNWLITLYLHVALIVSVYGLRQWFFGATALATWVDPTSPLANMTRVYSYLGNPNLLAGYLLSAVVLSGVAVVAWRGWLPKALALVMTVTNAACLVLTFSRGGWMGLVVALFIVAVLLVDWWSIHLPRLLRILALPLVLGGTVTVVALAIVFVEPVHDRVLSMFSGRGDTSNNYRLNVWQAVFKMINTYPILGIGPGNTAFRQVYVLFQNPDFNALGAYSIIFEVLVETGFVGLFVFLWLVLVAIWQGLRHLRLFRDSGYRDGVWLIAAIAIILGMLVHGLVDTVWFRPEVNTLWWLVMALISSYYRPGIAFQPVASLNAPENS